ncbi:retrovirus-related pol polyprotein from transposon TNT 1-94 [Tanacetum coccineum]
MDEYKKMKAKIVLLEASSSSSQNPKRSQVKILMALADNELTIGKRHARNGEWIDITIIKQIPHQKKKVLGGELFTESSSKMNENENLFVPDSMGYDQEMVPKTKDWVERLNPDSKLPNFNTRRFLVLKSQTVNESLIPSETLNTPESSKDFEADSLTLLPPLKNIQGALPSSECVSETVTGSETKQTTPSVPTEVKDTEQELKILYCMICKREDHRTSNHEMYTAFLKRSKNYMAQPYQSDDCRNYPECEICGSYDHSTSGHNCVIHIRGGVLAESSQSNESSIGVKSNTYGSTVYSTTNYKEFDHFKRGEKIQAAKAREPTKNGCSRSMNGVKSYLHKYVEQPGPKHGWKPIRIFLAFATYMNFKVYQMDVKSTFLNGKVKEEVYVKQPPSFESNEFPNYVCKLNKALYGLKQAPKACSLVKTPMVPPNNLGPDLAGFDLKGYPDSDYAGCNMDRKSTSGACQIFSRKLVCWSAKKQQSVAMSSAEAEYVVAAGCCTSIIWMKTQFSDYDIHYKMVPIFCDNTNAIAIFNNPVLHKHIDTHFIKDHILKGDIELHFIPIEYQLADIFTKPLDEPTFTKLKAELGMLNID